MHLEFGSKILVMGILNVTPDSFADGGLFFDHNVAVSHALELVAAGADILDIGGESTRPGARPVALDEERRRVLPGSGSSSQPSSNWFKPTRRTRSIGTIWSPPSISDAMR